MNKISFDPSVMRDQIRAEQASRARTGAMCKQTKTSIKAAIASGRYDDPTRFVLRAKNTLRFYSEPLGGFLAFNRSQATRMPLIQSQEIQVRFWNTKSEMEVA